MPVRQVGFRFRHGTRAPPEMCSGRGGCVLSFFSLFFEKCHSLYGMYTDQTGVAKALHVFVKYKEDEIVL
jgi:hypothetical protein